MRVNNIIMNTVKASRPCYMERILRSKAPVPVNDQLVLVERAVDRFGWDWQRASRQTLERILP